MANIGLFHENSSLVFCLMNLQNKAICKMNFFSHISQWYLNIVVWENFFETSIVYGGNGIAYTTLFDTLFDTFTLFVYETFV